MEQFDIYDINRQKTDRKGVRGEKTSPTDMRLVVHICIFNKKGQMLIQHRQPFKKGWSGLWDISVGGSAIAGDDSLMAARREVKEELGLDLTINHRPNFNINFDGGFDDFYIVDWDGDISDLTLQYEEVESVKWATKQEILAMISDGSFVPYYPSLIDMIFDMKNSAIKYGAHFRE